MRTRVDTQLSGTISLTLSTSSEICFQGQPTPMLTRTPRWRINSQCRGWYALIVTQMSDLSMMMVPDLSLRDSKLTMLQFILNLNLGLKSQSSARIKFYKWDKFVKILLMAGKHSWNWSMMKNVWIYPHSKIGWREKKPESLLRVKLKRCKEGHLD